MNLYQKIIEVKKQAKGFNKDTTGHGYKYVSGSQVLKKITDKMNEIGLLFIPVSAMHRDSRTFDYTTSKSEEKTDFIVEGSLQYAWVNADNPEERELINFEYYGQQNDISKAFGSALTYSERYLLLKSLGLQTDSDDPGSKDTAGKKARSNPRTYSVNQTKIMNAIKNTNFKTTDVEVLIKALFGRHLKADDLDTEQMDKLLTEIANQTL